MSQYINNHLCVYYLKKASALSKRRDLDSGVRYERLRIILNEHMSTKVGYIPHHTDTRPAAIGAAHAWLALAGALLLFGVLVWQGVTSGGDPDPLAAGISPSAALMNAGIVVFREGLEAILVLAALTASMMRKREDSWRPIAIGAAISLVASVVTWFVVVALIDSINAPALHVQAATGVLAILVLLVIMNWFFHKLYWAGWIGMHERRKRAVLEASADRRVFWGLFAVGLTAVYREGFEVVLFLQSFRLQAGNSPVLGGTLIGLGLTALVAYVTFIAQRKLPFRKLLVSTGVMLGAVLLVMVGASSALLQEAGWLPTTRLDLAIPAWVTAWFGVNATVEGLLAQLVAAMLIVGSYFMARARRA
jgi:high-affinity iron transporter